VVLAGAGGVQTLGPHEFAETALVRGAVVWFTPGVVHRLVNDGGLEILAIMSNAGLPEAGDAVLTFPADVLADVGRYREAATLPTPEHRPDADADDEVVAAAARTRRDLALEGFGTLRARREHEGSSGLHDLYAAAERLVADRVPECRKIWAASVLAETTATAHALADLAQGNAPHLAQAAVGSATAHLGPRGYGMCGRLTSYV